jgi:hypothetical protein
MIFELADAWTWDAERIFRILLMIASGAGVSESLRQYPHKNYAVTGPGRRVPVESVDCDLQGAFLEVKRLVGPGGLFLCSCLAVRFLVVWRVQ